MKNIKKMTIALTMAVLVSTHVMADAPKDGRNNRDNISDQIAKAVNNKKNSVSIKVNPSEIKKLMIQVAIRKADKQYKDVKVKKISVVKYYAKWISENSTGITLKELTVNVAGRN